MDIGRQRAGSKFKFLFFSIDKKKTAFAVMQKPCDKY